MDIEAIDMGRDVPTVDVVKAVKEYNPYVINWNSSHDNNNDGIP